jgi:hypothetical protein
VTQRILIALTVVALLSLAAWWFQKAWLSTAPVPAAISPTDGARAPLAPSEIRTLAASETAEVDTGAGFRRLQAGEALNVDSVIRTTAGVVVLALGDNIQVEVSENSQFRLGELTQNLSRAKLEGGHLEARVHGGAASKLAIEVVGTDTVAEASEGDFAILRGEDAQVTVASRRGQVTVAAKGESVFVKEGEQSVVVPSKPPTIPEKIPGSLFLKLTKMPGKTQRAREFVVEGVTAPGAVVSVGGVQVSAPDGRFRATVPLEEGDNEIQLDARDALGRTAGHESAKVFVDSRAPEIKARVVW